MKKRPLAYILLDGKHTHPATTAAENCSTENDII
jgi:hypothetical protein